MKIKHYIITGILATSLFLIINIPAATIVDAVKDKIPQVKIQGVSGTLWQGSAQQITIQSKHIFKNIDWSVCLSHLLMAQACVELKATYKKNPLSGQLSIDLNEHIQAKNIKTSMSAKTLTQIIALPMGEIDGNFSVDLSELNWKQGETPSASGVIKWDNASITIAETAQLGNVTITLSETDKNPVNAKIINQGGDISIDATASISTTNEYSVDSIITPNKASKNLRTSLGQFATPKPNGSFTFNNSNLKQLGLM